MTSQSKREIKFSGGQYYLSKNQSTSGLFSTNTYWCPKCRSIPYDCMYWIDSKTLEIHADGWCKEHGLVNLEWEIEDDKQKEAD